MKSLAAIPSSLSSGFVFKQSSRSPSWPRAQEFLQEMERFDSQPTKQRSWDQMDLRKFYYPKFNPDKLSYANKKSVSPSSTTATLMSRSSLSKLSGPQIGKASNGEYVFMYSLHTTDQAPEIPRAITAPYSFNYGRETLDRILDNPHSTTILVKQLPHYQAYPYPNYQVHRSAKPRMGNTYLCILTILQIRLQRFPGRYQHPTWTLENPHSTSNSTTNFYIRGFDPNTTDAMIQQIIDHLTNTCKRYGFIKYYIFADAENCIRGFYCRGHEAKFAKVGLLI